MRVSTVGILIVCGCQAVPPPSGGAPAPAGPGAVPLVEIAKEPATLPPGLPPPADMTLLAEDPPPEAFDDPTLSAGSAAYLPGIWKRADQALVQEAEGPGNKLMVRRYIGPGTGPGGALPERYRIQVSQWQYRFKGRDPIRDMGVLALIPWWKDARHFAILSARGDLAELWAADDTEPGQTWPVTNRFWTAALAPPLGVGDAVTWDVEVDIAAHRLAIHLNGERRFEADATLLTAPAQMAIAANGNQVKFKNFKIWGKTP